MTAKEEQKKFSLMKGFSFFWKSNLVLFIAIIFLYTNKSSWSEEGGSVLLVLALMWGVLILLLSIIDGIKSKSAESLKL
ncbi:hypothetical protein [Cytobacillus sp.]|uniref:hypothetical protein n=1 Tax=Cytobacillus sp. TaxID=2675269 RepID=UPI00351686B0